MPMRAPRIASCGCVVSIGMRCEHMRKRDAERKARHDQHRPSASARGYGGKWREARAQYLKAHPHCVMCGQPATVVDHRTPHKGDHKLFWSRSNWQALCGPCHNSAKQSQERRS